MKRIYSLITSPEAISTVFSILFLFGFVGVASAQLNVQPPIELPDDGRGTISIVVSFLINAAFFVAAILALFYLIWGGINWITSGGDQEAVDGARRRIIAAIIGLIIVVLAYFILDFVIQLLGACGINDLRVPNLTTTDAAPCQST